jgi:hypothetical protein
LDADGVLLNYNEAYANAWARAFGQRPALKDAQGYFPHDRWDVPMLGTDGREAAVPRRAAGEPSAPGL